MPPHTEDVFCQSSDEVVVLSPVSTTLTTTTTSVSTTRHRNFFLPPKDSVPFLKLRSRGSQQQHGVLDRVLEKGEEDRKTVLVNTLDNLKARVRVLLQELGEKDGGGGEQSLLRDACRQSLATRMPLVLHQCQILVDRIRSLDAAATQSSTRSDDDDDDDDANKGVAELELIATLRSSFALVAAVQFLDTVQEVLHKSDDHVVLDARLRQVLEVAASAVSASNKGVGDRFTSYVVPTFRVSHWAAPSLVFDLCCGPTIRTSLPFLPGRGEQLPLTLDVEPVIAYKAEDLLLKKDAVAFCGCVVEVLECRHRAHEFSKGSGFLGAAFVRIRVSPMERQVREETNATAVLTKKNPAHRMWGEKEVQHLVVKEVRAVQLNAFPPKSRALVDLYTTSMYGDSGVEVTLVIQTSVAEQIPHNEAPHLHVELFVAAPPSF